MKFIELIDYNPKYDTDYLKDLRKKAMSWLGTVNPDEWLHEIEGDTMSKAVLLDTSFFLRFLNENDSPV